MMVRDELEQRVGSVEEGAGDDDGPNKSRASPFLISSDTLYFCCLMVNL